MNNKEITRKEFLTIAGGVLVLLFGGIPSKIIKGIASKRSSVDLKPTANSTYGGRQNPSPIKNSVG